MKTMIASAIALMVQVPQAPVAAGPLESIHAVIDAASACGIRALRLQLHGSDAIGEARVFFASTPSDAAKECLDGWITANGVRLELLPRWYGDDFTSTKPMAD